MISIERNAYRILLIAAIGYILFLQMCNRGRPCPAPLEIVSEKVDTGYIIQQFVRTWKKPTPDTVIKKVPAKVPAPDIQYRDLPPEFIRVPVDTAAILKDYFAKAVYKDSTVTDYGSVIVEDTISQNRIQARKWVTNFRIPEITKNNTVAEKKYNQVFLGFSGLFGRQSIGAEINIGLLNKRGQQYVVGAGLLGPIEFVRVGTTQPISFRKNRR